MMFSWIFILIIVIGAIWYFGKKNGGSSFRKKEDRPIDILKHQFANGEITKEEYEEKRAVLK